MTERIEITINNVLRAVTAKVGKQELWLLCIACRLMVVNSYAKFDENISVYKLPSGQEFM